MKTVRLIVLALLLVCFAILFASCEGKTTLGTEAELVGAAGFTKEGTVLSLTVPNGTESYSFADKIEVSPGATWQISADPYGVRYSLTKAVSIHDGDNDYYLFVTSEDGKTVNRYTISIWCEADWYVVKDGVITGVTASFRTYAKNVEIPSEVNGEKITGIGERAFSGCSGLISITIPDGVTSIGGVTIPNSVTSIGDHAFSYCTGLTSVTIPDSVTSIGSDAFSGCNKLQYNEYDNACYLGNESNPYVALIKAKKVSITSCVIHPETKCIYDSAFEDCRGLTEITIPNGVTSIGWDAFSDCTGLKAVYYTGDVAGWCGIAFGSYGANPLCYAHNLYINGEHVTDLVIPDGVTSIGWYAFSGCSGLTSITIPNSVTSIGDGAFYYCTGLTSITIPDSVTSIGDSAFPGCTGLTSVTIPDSVTSIGECAFHNCSGLTAVTIGNGVTSIGGETFYGCTGLTSVTIPDSVTSIGWGAFYGCTGLTAIHYQGTKDQWNAISKAYYWNDNTGSYTVHCTD